MRLVVFGASGKAGAHVVAEALERGHEVVAFTSPVNGPGSPHRRLRTVSGDLRDAEAVRTALVGQEAALWTPGGVLLPKPTELSDGVRNVTEAMTRRGPRRLIFMSSLPLAESRLEATPYSAVFLVGLFQAYRFHDDSTQERYIAESSLDWTIIRPGVLYDGPRTVKLRTGFGTAEFPPDAVLSYADAADFMLAQLTDDAYRHKTVGVFQ